MGEQTAQPNKYKKNDTDLKALTEVRLVDATEPEGESTAKPVSQNENRLHIMGNPNATKASIM